MNNYMKDANLKDLALFINKKTNEVYIQFFSYIIFILNSKSLFNFFNL